MTLSASTPTAEPASTTRAHIETRAIDRSEGDALCGGLVAITCDAVAAGASLGWQSPLDPALAAEYWRGRFAALDGENVHLIAAYVDRSLAGAVQLERGHFPQSRHRGEIAKLMVHTAYRRRGVARRLMEALESLAARDGITTLVLDTRPREPVVFLYRSMGYAATGHIPDTIRGPNGDMQGTVFYYKRLGHGA